MCIAIPGEIVEIVINQAKIKLIGIETTVNIQLIENPKVGEYVLVHAGCAIEKIDREYFNDIGNLFKTMVDDWDDEKY